MSQKVKLVKSVLFVPFFLLLLPSLAFAYGNPLLALGLGGLAIIHFGFAMFLVFRKIGWGKKGMIIGVYFIVILFIWNWALNCRGPDFSIMFTALLFIPLISFLCLVYVANKVSKSSRQN